MANKKERLKNYSIGKGAYKGWWGYQELRDMLLDIHQSHKKWGKDWYSAVSDGFYDTAKKLLDIKGTGADKDKAIDMINRIIDIKRAEMRGDR